MKIAYLGPEGSYSHIAAEYFLKNERNEKGEREPYELDECMPFRSFSEVFKAVQNKRVNMAAVPIENSLQGGVLQNLDLLYGSENLYAVSEYILKIDHRLIYKKDKKFSEIGRVYSHRQALDQCSQFLGREMPFASLKETESTGFGVSKMAEDQSGTSAAIAGSHTILIPEGFVMSEECISDEKNNLTQFLLLKNGKDEITHKCDKFFFAVTCPHRPGGLLELLEVIASNGINMTKIESRPIKNRPGEYRFFIEAEGDINNESIKTAVDGIFKHTLEAKLLGAY